MPVFLVSQTIGQAFSMGSNTYFFETSHQEAYYGRCMSTNIPTKDKFLAFHPSGGTTEIVLTEWKGIGLPKELLGVAKI